MWIICNWKLFVKVGFLKHYIAVLKNLWKVDASFINLELILLFRNAGFT